MSGLFANLLYFVIVSFVTGYTTPLHVCLSRASKANVGCFCVVFCWRVGICVCCVDMCAHDMVESMKRNVARRVCGLCKETRRRLACELLMSSCVM